MHVPAGLLRAREERDRSWLKKTKSSSAGLAHTTEPYPPAPTNPPARKASVTPRRPDRIPDAVRTRTSGWSWGGCAVVVWSIVGSRRTLRRWPTGQRRDHDRPAGGLIRPMLATAGPVPVGPGVGVRGQVRRGPRHRLRRTRRPEAVQPQRPRHLPLLPGGRRARARGGRDRRRRTRRAGRARPPGLRPVAAPHARHDTHRGADRAGAGAVRRVRPAAPRGPIAAGAALRPTTRTVWTASDLERPGLRVPANFTDVAGEVVLAAIAQQGLEGVVAKRLVSPVSAGAPVAGVDQDPDPAHRGGHHRGLVTQHRQRPRAGFVAAGRARPGRASWCMSVTSVPGSPTPPAAVCWSCCGRCTATTRRSRGEFVRARGWPGRPPSRGPVHWVAPQLVGEIEYRSFTLNRTTAGGTFRHPSWRGLREDKSATEVAMPSKGYE